MLINIIRRFVAFRLFPIRRLLEVITNSIWYDSPFGTKPHASKQVYLSLAEIAKKEVYHEIDDYEQQTGFTIDSYWLHELALHTQIVVKNSPLCYAHGRVLFSALSKYLANDLPDSSAHLTIWETGTARGFSAI